LGCEWCQLDSDEETPLETPFCTHQSKCFNGVLGSLTPYGDNALGMFILGIVFLTSWYILDNN
jgi:hypothetical protein